MPSGTFHLKELDSDKITLDGTLSVSGASTLKGDVALSSNLTVAGDTALANTSASNVDVDGTLSVSGITTIGGHILPSVNDAFDIGSPEFKIRDLYVSDNSLWIGDVTKISFSGGKMKFRKRKTDVVPAAILEAGRNAGHQNDQATVESALAHFNKSSLTDMKLFHWQKYMRDVLSVAAEITDIFRDNDEDYEETSASDAWKEIDDTKIYTNTHVGIGTSDPDEALHIRGAIKVEDGFSLARNDGDNPSLIIDTTNFGLDETVNDLTGNEFSKYTKLYRVYGTNSQGVGKNWYWGYAEDDYTKFSLSFDGAGGNDPDIAFVFTTASELHCNAVHAALVGNADTATRLQTARNINGVAFDGSADITVGIDGITSSNNNIGIGISDPKQKLQVNGNVFLAGGEAGNILHGDKKLALQSDATVLIVCDTNDTTGEGSSGDIIFGSGSSYDTNNNKDFTWSQAYSHGNNPRNERMRIKGTGQVGIGTDNPAYILDVQTSDFDNARFKRTVAGGGVGVQLENGDGDVWNIGTGGSGQFGIYRDGQEFGTDFYMADNGRVGIGTTSPTNPLHVQSTSTGTHTMRVTHTDTAATGGSHGLIIDANYSGSDTFEGDKANAGIYIDMDSSATGGTTGQEHRMYGVYSDVRHTGDSDIVYGGWFFARSDHAEGTNTALKGINAVAQDSGTGTNSLVYGGEFKALKDGGSTNTTPTMIGIRAEVEVDAGTVTNAYGVSSVIDRDGGTITNGYLFYGAYQGTNVTNNWGIYSAGATKNYLSGNVGIGITSPGAKLHVNGNAILGDVGAYGGTHTDAQLTLGGTHNTSYNNSNQVKLLISGGNNDSGSPYYIMCEDENGHDQFYVKGATNDDGSPTGRLFMNGRVGIGTSSPEYELHVRGHCWSEGFRCTSLPSGGTYYNFPGGDGGISDGIFHRPDGQAYITVDDQFFIRDNANTTDLRRFYFETNTGKFYAESTIAANYGLDYAEYFEWFDGNPNDEDRIGNTVCLEQNTGKIKLCQSGDKPIGVVSGTSSMVGGASEVHWQGYWKNDEWGRPIYEQTKDNDGNLMYNEDGTPKMKRAINPEYDAALYKSYVPRSQRKEWACIGLLGQVYVKKHAVVSDNWLKIKDVDDVKEYWFINSVFTDEAEIKQELESEKKNNQDLKSLVETLVTRIEALESTR